MPLRLCGPPSARDLELRLLDGTANPYLALAAVLGVGLKGIKDETPLEVEPCEGAGPDGLQWNEREQKGIKERVPSSPWEAREALKKDGVVKEVLGEEVVSAYLAVNEAFERAVQTEAGRLGGDVLRVMAENW